MSSPVFSWRMVPSVYQRVWEVYAQTSSGYAAAAAVGVERSSVTKWIAADGGVRPRQGLNAIAAFTVGALVVMVLLRRVVGDRDQRLGLAERERGLAAREAILEEGARIARELHDVIPPRVDDGRAGGRRTPGAWPGAGVRT
ncbi:hypothetical protein EKO23_23000 [Nocardioides guangzhouensis]|uniref:Sensor histidine kinase n=1 Tax=Nocardioides guangzhouensis TaxID=2497878 RepID=A0A4Q4Z2I0_9ACTN|nr:hypothetical protein [Nocardioides guangzhouensis]RYP81850.1 hypothetical protein EKO23_23000 [Nocardioides guangzhouensis]